MKMVSFGADISDNDISCSNQLINNIENSLHKIESKSKLAKLTNITGDDMVITAVVEDDKLEDANKLIYDVLYENAMGFDDLNGVGKTKDEAGEGISYAEIKLNPDFYPDAVIIGFDTYCGESFVDHAAKSAVDAAAGMDSVGCVGGSCANDTRLIPGVGYVSSKTDDPVVIASVENVEQVGVVAGAMIGAILGNKNTYLVRRNTPANVIPGSVICTVTALMNGNVIDLASPLSNRMKILEK